MKTLSINPYLCSYSFRFVFFWNESSKVGLIKTSDISYQLSAMSYQLIPSPVPGLLSARYELPASNALAFLAALLRFPRSCAESSCFRIR